MRHHTSADWNAITYSLLRFVSGFLFIFHGLQKMFGMFGGHQAALGTMPGMAGLIETIAGTLIMIGLFTSVAAFIASGEMAVAYFMMHAPNGSVPLQNGGELAALYCFLFLYVAARGDGRYSVGAAVGRAPLTRRVGA